MNKLTSWSTLLVASLFAIQSHGAGTAAGTTIVNQATVSYEVGGGTVTASSTEVEVVVQELIDITIISQDSGNVGVSSPDTDAELKFQLSNTGNGNEAFVIKQINFTGEDQFNAGTYKVYLDDGDGIYQPDAEDVLLENNTTAEITPDAYITIWVSSQIPENLNNNDSAQVEVSALSKTFSDDDQTSPEAGDTVSGGGEAILNGGGTTNAVYGTGAANAEDKATFVVSAINVTIVKEITDINDNLGLVNNVKTNISGQAVPGAEVTYSLKVTVTGTGDAENVIANDTLPEELVLKDEENGKIYIDGAEHSADSGDDQASYDKATRQISVDLQTISAGSDPKIITFTTVIQ